MKQKTTRTMTNGIRTMPKTGPAESGSQAGGEQRGERGARVAGAGDAHRRALVLGRIPARSERQRGSERRAGNTQEETEDQHFGVGMNAGQPGVGHRGDDDDLADDGGLLRRQAVDQNAHDDAQQGSGQHRGGDHQALLGVRQAEVLGDADAERAEDDPDHEGEVEIEEGGEQGRRVAGLQE